MFKIFKNAEVTLVMIVISLFIIAACSADNLGHAVVHALNFSA